MDLDGNEVNKEGLEAQCSTPHLPRINTGYNTPDSDYNYEVSKHLNQPNGVEKQSSVAILKEPPTDTSTYYASSMVSDSDESVSKESQLTETQSVKTDRASSKCSKSKKAHIRKTSKISKRKDSRRCSSSYAGSVCSNSQKSFKECTKANNRSDSQRSTKDTKLRPKNVQGPRRSSIRFDQQTETTRTSNIAQAQSTTQNRRESFDNKVIRSCTHTEGFGNHKNQSLSFPHVDQNERGSKSARELGLTFDHDFGTPVIRSPKSSAKSQVAESEDYYTIGSHYKLSLVDSNSVTVRSSPDKLDRRKSAWGAPRISTQLYQDLKEHLLKEGKFKERLRKYWSLDLQDQINQPDSDDDGYDTDLDKNLGKHSAEKNENELQS